MKCADACLLQDRFACICDCMCACVLERVIVCMSLYTNYSPLRIHMGVRIAPTSDVGALGMIGGGSCWWVAASLFGIVETIVVLVGAG